MPLMNPADLGDGGANLFGGWEFLRRHSEDEQKLLATGGDNLIRRNSREAGGFFDTVENWNFFEVNRDFCAAGIRDMRCIGGETVGYVYHRRRAELCERLAEAELWLGAKEATE